MKTNHQKTKMERVSVKQAMGLVNHMEDRKREERGKSQKFNRLKKMKRKGRK